MSGPPFDRYPVTSATIRARAEAISKSARPLVAVMNAMDGPRQRAADAVDGELDGQIEGPVEPAQRQAISTATGAKLCGGAIDLFANYVDLFNLAVDDLNRRWEQAKAHDFDVPIGDGSAKEHDEAVAEARALMASELRREFGTVEEALDDGARDVATVLNAGPKGGAPLLDNYRASTQLSLVMRSLFPPGGGPSLAEIQRTYQVGDDPGGVIAWEPYWPLSLATEGPIPVTAIEAEMLDELGAFALKDMKEMHDRAFDTADDRFVEEDKNDNHNDAFRHAYWNAMMARRFGEEWARNYANAHEGRPGNQQVREAMDLYNNEVGRRIGLNNAGVSDEELADLVEEAVRNGDTVVVAPDGGLAWSNTISEGGHTGDADNFPVGPKDGNPDNNPDPGADPDSHNDHGTGS